MKISNAHKKRIESELKAAHMTAYGLLKMETAKLPEIIHENEHIGGVVYGRTTDEKVGSAMLVATDKRIIFLDVKPIFSTMDEVSYYVVSGIKSNHVGPFAGVVLHTKIRDYGLRFVNVKCAETFVEYIENHIELHNLEAVSSHTDSSSKISTDPTIEYIENNNTAVLSTIDREGNVHGSVIHYIYDNDCFYFVTKQETAKKQHIATHGQVALTIHESNSLKMAAVSAMASLETDSSIRAKVYSAISSPKRYAEGEHLPPIVSMSRGEIVVIKLTPIDIKFSDFSKKSW